MDHSFRKRTLEFLDLPGEIRNMIYSECFPTDRALEVNFSPFNRYHSAQKHDLVMEEVLFRTCQEFDMLTPPVMKDRPNPHGIDVPRAPPSKSSSNQLDKETNGNRRRHFGAGLLSTCMRTYQESRYVLYSRPIFMFSSSKRLRHFVTIVSSESLALVRHVYISELTCGILAASKQGILKDLYEKNWLAMAQVAASKLTGLRNLEAWMILSNSPLHLDFSKTWAQTILAFGTMRRSIAEDNSSGQPAHDRRPLNVQVELRDYPGRSLPFLRVPPSARNDALIRLHVLFAEALCRRVMGWSEADSLRNFKKVESQCSELLRS